MAKLKIEDFVGDGAATWTVTKVEPFDPTMMVHRALGVAPNDELIFTRQGATDQVNIRNETAGWSDQDAWITVFSDFQVELSGNVDLPFKPNELINLAELAMSGARPALMAEFLEHLRENRGDNSLQLSDLPGSTGALYDMLGKQGKEGPAGSRGIVERFTFNVKYIGNSSEYSYLIDQGCATGEDKEVMMFVWTNRFKHAGGTAHAEH